MSVKVIHTRTHAHKMGKMMILGVVMLLLMSVVAIGMESALRKPGFVSGLPGEPRQPIKLGLLGELFGVTNPNVGGGIAAGAFFILMIPTVVFFGEMDKRNEQMFKDE